MGSAILGGILDATRSDTTTTTTTPRISSFITSTKSAASAERLRKQFAQDESRVRFLHSQNLQAMQEADIVILACKPYMAADVLGAEGVMEALSGKFVISILAGKTVKDIEECIFPLDTIQQQQSSIQNQQKPHIVRAMPNVAASLRESMTIIETPSSSVPAHLSEALEWIFAQIGKVKFLTADLFEVGTMLVGSSMAVMTVPLDGFLDGCVTEGLRRADALEMAAQVLLGMAKLLKEGAHPAVLRESISSPRGCTIQGLVTVEKAGTRGAFAQAAIDGTRHLQGGKR